MVTTKTIKCEDEAEQTTYGIKGTCGTVEYSFDDISADKDNAEKIDKLLSAVALPIHLIDRIVYSLAGILTESNIE